MNMNMQLRILLGVCIAMAASSPDSDCFIKPFARNITVEVRRYLQNLESRYQDEPYKADP